MVTRRVPVVGFLGRQGSGNGLFWEWRSWRGTLVFIFTFPSGGLCKVQVRWVLFVWNVGSRCSSLGFTLIEPCALVIQNRVPLQRVRITNQEKSSYFHSHETIRLRWSEFFVILASFSASEVLFEFFVGIVGLSLLLRRRFVSWNCCGLCQVPHDICTVYDSCYTKAFHIAIKLYFSPIWVLQITVQELEISSILRVFSTFKGHYSP